MTTMEAIAAQGTLRSTYPTLAAVWDLDKTHEQESAPEAAFLDQQSAEAVVEDADQPRKTVIGDDGRKLVKREDFAPGGKYRPIVKLFGRMEGQKPGDPWMMATGWLIRDDLLVTAGHVSCDWSHSLGLLKELKVYIGYDGRENVKNPSVEFRHGASVTCPAQWLQGPSPIFDVAFVMINKPFDSVQPMRYADTPAKGTLNIGVVGYPGDRKSEGEKHAGEHMYEMFQKTTFSLTRSKNLLTYQIDTFGGNSGSPALAKEAMAAIGVHVQGGKENSASCIGPLGNDFERFVKAFNIKAAGKQAQTGVKAKAFRIVEVGSDSKPAARGSAKRVDSGKSGVGESLLLDEDGEIVEGEPNPDGSVPEAVLDVAEGELDNDPTESTMDEGFLDVIKKGLGVVVGAASSGTAGAIASVAGAALPVIIDQFKKPKEKKEATWSESTTDESATFFGPKSPFKGVAERAVLAEASLQALVGLPDATLQKHEIIKKLRPHIIKVGPAVTRLDAKLCNLMLPTCATMLIKDLPRAQQDQPKKSKGPHEGFVEAIVTADESTMESAEMEAFVMRALDPATPTQSESLAQYESMAQSINEATADETSPEAEYDAKLTAANPMKGRAHRAVLAEAALQTMLTVPPQAPEIEGLWDTVARNLGKIGKKCTEGNPIHTMAAIVSMPAAIKTAIGGSSSNLLKRESTVAAKTASKTAGADTSNASAPAADPTSDPTAVADSADKSDTSLTKGMNGGPEPIDLKPNANPASGSKKAASASKPAEADLEALLGNDFLARCGHGKYSTMTKKNAGVPDGLAQPALRIHAPLVRAAA